MENTLTDMDVVNVKQEPEWNSSNNVPVLTSLKHECDFEAESESEYADCQTYISKDVHHRKPRQNHASGNLQLFNANNGHFVWKSEIQEETRPHEQEVPHIGEKPYQCTFCKKCFTIRSNLKKHMRVHTGDKPYQCTVCTKCFANRSYLKTHMRTHTGD